MDPSGSSSNAAGTSSTPQAPGDAKKTDNESSESEKARKKKEDEEQLAKIYEGFQFDGLWSKLSESLSRMEDDSSAAMILLPLIEVSLACSQGKQRCPM